MGNIIFRRIGGRIVPIAKKLKSTPDAHLWGGIIGSEVGHNVARSAKHSQKEQDKMLDSFNEKQVSSKKFVMQSGVKNVRVITRPADIKWKDHPVVQIAGPQLARISRAGLNAAATTKLGSKHYLFARKNLNKDILAHELGHIKDFKKHGNPGFFETGLIGSLTGGVLKREVAAWNEAGISSRNKTRQMALKSYERAQSAARIGLPLGTIAGAVFGPKAFNLAKNAVVKVLRKKLLKGA